MTSCNRGLLVGWNGGVRGGRGRGRAPLGRRVPLGGRVAF